MFKKILLVLLVVLIVIQFFRPEMNVSKGEQPNALANAYSAPPGVKSILQKACDDCHTNNTRYPWYNRVQPVAWWLSKHVKEGKEHLNLDEFLSYEPRRQDHKMEEVVEMVKSKEMPLKSYTWGHSNAKLSDAERVALTSWAEQVRKEITARTGFIPKLSQ